MKKILKKISKKPKNIYKVICVLLIFKENRYNNILDK